MIWIMSPRHKAPKVILGLDPGYGRLGFGVLRRSSSGELEYVACGVITTSKQVSMPQRLLEIASDIRALIDKYEPELVVIEELFFVQNITTGIKVAEVRGVIQLLVCEAGIECVDVKPVQVKKALTGQGHADKRQMQKMITLVLGLKTIPKPDDAADALAIAWAGDRKWS